MNDALDRRLDNLLKNHSNGEPYTGSRPGDRKTPEEIRRQRRKGWVDFHPEDYCHLCGHRFVPWHGPEFHEMTRTPNNGIICARCYMLAMPEPERGTVWIVTRRQNGHPQTALDRLASLLRHVSDLGDDAERVASCILTATPPDGWLPDSGGDAA